MHKGHNYLYRYSSGGKCDCGDSDCILNSNFCKLHSYKIIFYREKTNIVIPNEILDSFKSTCDFVIKTIHQYFFNYLKCYDKKFEDISSKQNLFIMLNNDTNTYDEVQRLFGIILPDAEPNEIYDHTKGIDNIGYEIMVLL